MRTHRRTRRLPGAARKGSHPRLRALRSRPKEERKLSERNVRTSEGVAKRRLRSMKRETGGGRSRQRRTSSR